MDPDVGPGGPGASHGVWIKDETAQPTGSFKVRGAANALLSLDPERRAAGVVAVSTGNHGRAVAYVARRLGARADVFVSERVPPGKLDALRAEGATVHVGGDSQDAAEEHARAFARERGATLIPPFDHPGVIAGQGTLGLELLDELPELATLIVPVSGGGLIAGTALAVRSAAPDVRIVGVSMEEGAIMHASLQAGRPMTMPEADTLADSLQGGLGADNAYTFTMVRELVDEIVLVPETALAAAMRHGFRVHRRVLEGGGAAAIAALASGAVGVRGPTVAVASGGNVDEATFARVLAEGGDDEPHRQT
ncbi:MAG: pyridoxal-phosphate dependent enzyme [Trueperaceae bacterium]|nr:pyridoxal-phosphate dependent enzyme [Trueperaceae bacterium]